MMTLDDTLDYALAYAHAGFSVIPVRGKIPLTEHGAHDASIDESAIRAWWKRWPDAGIGMTLEGLVVVDVDPRNGGATELLPHALPETCYQKTGGGGWHYLYRSANGTRYPGQLAPGVDCKSGAGAYIVVEPTVHASGERYCWIDETEPWTTAPTAAPGWLARAPTAIPGAGTPSGASIPEGGRNAALTSLAGTMRRRGMASEAIEAALLAENAAKCSPPLPAEEVRKIAASVSKYEAPEGQAESAGAASHEWPLSLALDVLADREPEAPRFIIDDWLPAGYATLFAGHGGAGKSSIALYLLVCIAAGVPFFGLDVGRRRVLYLSCEDRENVLHWRLARICKHLGADMANLKGWLQIIDLVGHDSVLWERDARTGNTVTASYGRLDARVREYETEVICIDGISDAYGGNEIARAEVKKFINTLIALIPADSGAVLLIGHLNKPTALSGASSEGYSGSTAWHNSVRARWYLRTETAQGDDGAPPERTGDLILELQKSNLGRSDQSMRFAWDPGERMFLGRAVASEMAFDKVQRDRAEAEGVLAAFRACAASNPPVVVPATMQGPRTGYHVLSLQPEFPETLRSGKPGVRRFWRHIEQMRRIHTIEETPYRRANRHVIAQFVLTTEGVRRCAA